MTRQTNIWQALDGWTIVMFLALVAFGWVNVCGASYTYDQTSLLDFSSRAGKQFVWIMGALVLGGVILLIDPKTYDFIAYILYGAMILLLLITPFLARDVKGSLSWLQFGPVSLQPAEFAKCVTALALAKYMGRYEYRVRDWRDLVMPFVIIGLPALIIMILQKETGSALVFASFLLVFYRQGMSSYVLLWGVMLVLLFVVVIRLGAVMLPLGVGNWGILTSCLLLIAIFLYYIYKERETRALIFAASGVAFVYTVCSILAIWFPVNFDWVSMGVVVLCACFDMYLAYSKRHPHLWLVVIFLITSLGFCKACNFVFDHVLQPHQRVRIEVLLGLKEDLSGAGYNVNQSKIAIGSGGFAGKGFLQGTQTKLSFVPEQATDFIFCTVGEEWGFLGSAGVLLLYLIFILRLIFIAERQKDMFSQIFAYSVAGIFLFHLTINIGMVLGLLPVIGIPLPFFSYGGSSLWGFTILLFILLRLDASRMEKL